MRCHSHPIAMAACSESGRARRAPNGARSSFGPRPPQPSPAHKVTAPPPEAVTLAVQCHQTGPRLKLERARFFSMSASRSRRPPRERGEPAAPKSQQPWEAAEVAQLEQLYQEHLPSTAAEWISLAEQLGTGRTWANVQWKVTHCGWRQQAQRRQRGTDWSAAAAPSRSGRLTHKKGGERFIDQKKRPAATEGSPSEAAAPHKKQGTQVAAPEPQPRQTQVQRRRSGHVAMKGPKQLYEEHLPNSVTDWISVAELLDTGRPLAAC